MLIINLKTEQLKKNYSLLSDRLLTKIDQCLQNNKKVLLFHNRKGYARQIKCADCNYLLECRECGLPQIMPQNPKQKNLVYCPYCRNKKTLKPCPNCQGTNWRFTGEGLKKIKQELETYFKIKVKILKNKTLNKLNQNLALATYPPEINPIKTTFNIGLAAILNTDTDFYLPDYNASLRVFNRIIAFKKFCCQLKIKNKILQTYTPNNQTILQAVKEEFTKFKKQELQKRKDLKYPPYGKLIKLIYQNKNYQICASKTQKMYQTLKKYPYQVSPAQPCFRPKIRGNWRWQIVLKIKNQKIKQLKSLKKLLFNLSSAWLIDVDPISLL